MHKSAPVNPFCMRSWICPIDSVNADEVASMDKSQMAMARMLSVATYESGSLYTGLPSTVDGTRLSDTELTMAVGLRLGVAVAAPG